MGQQGQVSLVLLVFSIPGLPGKVGVAGCSDALATATAPPPKLFPWLLGLQIRAVLGQFSFIIHSADMADCAGPSFSP